MPTYKDYAVKINKETLDKIAAVNGGVRPENRKNTYFIYPENPDVHCLILSEKNFRRNFEFVQPERENEFTEIREIV